MNSIYSKVYRTWQCAWCRKRFEDKDRIYYIIQLQGLNFCEDCKDLLENPPDFNPEGTMETGTISWKTARLLTLWRDDCHCRVCGEPHRRDNPIEVHHIIPKKNGGTHNLKNLITLCEKHHKETYKNDYAGLQIREFLAQQGIQKRLLEVSNKQ